MHPYQLHQTLVERGDTRIVRVNPGAVYHGVERLERDGLVEVVGTDRDGQAPRAHHLPRSPTRAARRSPRGWPACSATSTRRTRCSRSGWPRRTSSRSTVVVEQLTRRRDRKARTCAALEASYGASRDLGLPRRYLLDVEHDLALLRAEIAWLDGTLDELRADALDWGAPFPPVPRGQARPAPSIRTPSLVQHSPDSSKDTS